MAENSKEYTVYYEPYIVYSKNIQYYKDTTASIKNRQFVKKYMNFTPKHA